MLKPKKQIFIFLILAITTCKAPETFRLVDSGSFIPPKFGKEKPTPIKVDRFSIAEKPVSNKEFLDFVIENPEWQRDNVDRRFADSRYLEHWPSATSVEDSNSPVTFVSWFAARAFAEWKGLRLPNMAEWEYANISSTTTNYEWVEDFNHYPLVEFSASDKFICGGIEIELVNSKIPSAKRYATRSSLMPQNCESSLSFRCVKGETKPPTSFKDYFPSNDAMTLVSFIFTSCQNACPLIISDIKKIVKECPNIKVKLISFDSNRDTSKVLKNFAKQYDLKENIYSLYQPNEYDLRCLTAEFGLRYSIIEGGDYLHTSLLSLINKDGDLVAQTSNVNSNTDLFIDMIKRDNSK